MEANQLNQVFSHSRQAIQSLGSHCGTVEVETLAWLTAAFKALRAWHCMIIWSGPE
jgi:hypothetical protein